ncbi:uncharacterized protein LOC127799053 [Diospyros lotus]|uniref:uncharacterized protein LOC127799053 n=1 Tax=Diospyros lotus TaxID=55363 RepID=UPI00224D8533|nr:uncharacterized protein LOC127799053 [Diospyros lotus]
MSKSSRHKEKHGSRSELSKDKWNEGTAARTRPFSFDEIMLRRKNKKQSGDLEAAGGEEGNRSNKEIVEKASDHPESGRVYRKSIGSVVVKHSSEELMKVGSRKKEDNASMNEDKRNYKESRESQIKSMASLNKDDRQSRRSRKNEERSSGDSENEHEKRRARDLVRWERYEERSRGKSEKEAKRKHRNDDDERSRDKDTVKKHDSGKWHNSEISERKGRTESSRLHNEESRSRKRRSRSRELRDKDRVRRSLSLSPRSHKCTTDNVRGHGELSTDRSRRQQSDDDRNKISVNSSSNHYRRHGGSASGLGGYSPRKRKTEAAVKTPSPPHRSPEKKSAGWDLPPAGAAINTPSSVISNLQSSNQTVSSTNELSTVTPVSSMTVRALPGVFANAAIESIQLTQATRPMRRLYVENLPASATEKGVMECLNNFLLFSGVNYIQGTQPCISCIIHKEKGQALVEFLTPEDASAALSFDGRSFSGSFLRIRRPKDYVEVATAVFDKSVAAVDTTSDIVKDSPHKIFIGGISKAISSEMLREIARAFGPLKAFHFEVNVDIGEPCAFIEYVDQSVTVKACAGLNGMKLGGQMLTVVLATPDASSDESIGNSPFYGIPEHAKALLEKPTKVLKLRDALDPENLSSLSEPELEEILEDIRLECARFGTVKSVNIVKCHDGHTITEKYKLSDGIVSSSICQDLNCSKNIIAEISGDHVVCDLHAFSRLEPPGNAKEPEQIDEAVLGDIVCDDKLAADIAEDKMCKPAAIDGKGGLKDPLYKDSSKATSLEIDDQLSLEDQINAASVEIDEQQSLKDPIEGSGADTVDDHSMTKKAEIKNGSVVQEKLNHEDDMVDDGILTKDAETKADPMLEEKLTSEESNGKLEEASAQSNGGTKMNSDAFEKNENKDQGIDLDILFEPGSILVEYARTAASSMAAHSLHGRLFDNRTVTVEYVSYDLYKAKFLK